MEGVGPAGPAGEERQQKEEPLQEQMCAPGGNQNQGPEEAEKGAAAGAEARVQLDTGTSGSQRDEDSQDNQQCSMTSEQELWEKKH